MVIDTDNLPPHTHIYRMSASVWVLFAPEATPPDTIVHHRGLTLRPRSTAHRGGQHYTHLEVNDG